MFFKNALIYALDQRIDLFLFTEKMADKAFTPCLAIEASATGWTKPAEYMPDDSLVSRIGQYDVIALKTESKILPGSAVNKILAEKISALELKEDRKLKFKERSVLKDEIIHDLLPRALTQESVTFAYIDRIKNRIIIDASAPSKAENVLSFLRKTLGSLPAVPLKLNHKPSAIITAWLSKGFPNDISGNSNISITTEEEGILGFKNIDLLSHEVQMHIDCGGVVKKISLLWDEKVSFELSSTMEIKKIKLLNIAQEDLDSTAALFEADLILFANTLDELLERLITEFGGEHVEIEIKV